MRIQMAMKQMPLDDGAMPNGMGLRVKNPTVKQQQELQAEFEMAPPVIVKAEDSPFEEQLTEQEKFALDKKLFAQQMKEQLLGRKPAASADQEEVKAGGQVINQDQDYKRSQPFGDYDSEDEDDEAEMVDNRVGLEDEKSFDS